MRFLLFFLYSQIETNYLHCLWCWSDIITIINVFNNHTLDNKRHLSRLWCLWLHDRFVLNYRAHYLLIAIKHAELEISPQLDGSHRFLCQLASRWSLVWCEITRLCRFSIFQVMLVFSFWEWKGCPCETRSGLPFNVGWCYNTAIVTIKVMCRNKLVITKAGRLTGILSWPFCSFLSRFTLSILPLQRQDHSDTRSLEPRHGEYTRSFYMHVFIAQQTTRQPSPVHH